VLHPRIVPRLPAPEASVAAETLDVVVAALRENKELSVGLVEFKGDSWRVKRGSSYEDDGLKPI